MINCIKYENPNDAIYHFSNLIGPTLLIYVILQLIQDTKFPEKQNNFS